MEQCYSVHPLQYANRACCMQILPRISAAALQLSAERCYGAAVWSSCTPYKNSPSQVLSKGDPQLRAPHAHGIECLSLYGIHAGAAETDKQADKQMRKAFALAERFSLSGRLAPRIMTRNSRIESFSDSPSLPS